MLDFLILIIQFAIFVKSTEDLNEFNIDHSFYIYTTEKIDKIQYFPPLDDEGHGILKPKEISLLSYKDNNIGDINIPDFMVPYIYKISFKMIPGVPTKINLLKHGDTTVIYIDIDEDNTMAFYKIFPLDSAESVNCQQMIFEVKRLDSIFYESDIYIIEKNSLLFDKFKMNLECFEALHNLKYLKNKLNLIISASQDKLNSLDKSDEAITSEKTEWSSITYGLIGFNNYLTCIIFRVINEVFELRDIDGDFIAKFSDKEVMEILSQKIDLISNSKSLAIYCRTIFDDVTITKDFIKEERVRIRQLNVSIPEIKKAFEIVKKFYSDFNTIKEVSKINISRIDDETECFRQISELLNYFLKLITMFENFSKTRKSVEGTSTQENYNYGSQRDLETSKILIQRHINNIPSLNVGNYNNVEFIKGHTLETMTNECKEVEKVFYLLIDSFKERYLEKYDFYQLTINFKNIVSDFKESVVRFKNIIEYLISEISFRKNVFINDLISNMHENNETGHASTD